MDNRAEVANLRNARTSRSGQRALRIFRVNADVSDEATRLYNFHSPGARFYHYSREDGTSSTRGSIGPSRASLAQSACSRPRTAVSISSTVRTPPFTSRLGPSEKTSSSGPSWSDFSGAARRKSSMTMKRNEWFTRMREYWLKSRRSEALVVALHALHPLPTELRQRVVKQAEDLEWRSFIAENKHRFQTVPARHKDLTRELSKLGCGAIRSDSRLCKGFVNGSVTAKLDGQQWTAKRVARRMAEMKYVHQYCEAFREEVSETEQKVDELHEENLRRLEIKIEQEKARGKKNKGRGRFWKEDERMFAEMDACEEITGYRSFGSFVRGLAEDWKDFPERWPWLDRTRA